MTEINYTPGGGAGGPGGPNISGEFISMYTGNSINVRDTVQMEDGKTYVRVITENDEEQLILLNDFNNEYYQEDNNLYDENGSVIGQQEVSRPVPVQKQTNSKMFEGMTDNASKNVESVIVTPKKSNELVERVFKKKEIPTPDISIVFDGCTLPKF